MKIVHLTSVHPAFDIRIFQKECRSLARAGFDVTVIAPHERDEVADRVRICAIPPVQGRGPRMTLTTWRVLRESLRQKADLYHLHDPELIPVGLFLRALGKQVIYDVHENLPKDVLSKEYLPMWSRKFLGQLLGALESVASRAFSAVVAVSPFIAERFRSANGKIVLVQNFPDLTEVAASAPPRWQAREMEVAFAGGLLEDRGILEMVRAMGLLPRHSKAVLNIASAEDPLEFMPKLAEEAGWSRVRYLGYLNRAGISALLGRVRAGLVLYLPAPHNLEAMPHKLFEYMAAGIPVIASDFRHWREMLGPTGAVYFVNPLDPYAIAGAIDSVLSHPEEAEQMGRRGQAAVRAMFNWESQAQELLKLYARVMAPVCAE